MKKNIVFILILMLLMVFIPLLSCIGREDVFKTPSSSAQGKASSSARASSNTSSSSAAPEAQNTPEDSFALYDEASKRVITVDARDYLCGALAAEMLPSFHMEALKAQAVVLYTYAYRRRVQEEASPTPDLQGAVMKVNTGTKQGYFPREAAEKAWGKQFDESWAHIEESVDAVLGQLIVYHGEPILAAFHAISSGKTEASKVYWEEDLPYLQSVESPGDLKAPNYETTLSLTQQEMKALLIKAWPQIKLPDDPSQWITDIQKSEAGTVTSIKVGDQTATGRQLREILSLRSANFDIQSGESFTVTVHGYGHGVGLSQYGAEEMARQGKSFQDIIRHYYTAEVQIITAPAYASA